MKDTVSKSKLALRSRFTEKYEQPANLLDWISGSGKEFFYIVCKEVRRNVSGKRYYLCVFKPSTHGLEEQEYITGCKLREDRDNPETHMLFSLIKPRKPKSHPDEDEASEDDNQSDLTPTEGPNDKTAEGGHRLGLTPNKISKNEGDRTPSERPKDKITEEGTMVVCESCILVYTQ